MSIGDAVPALQWIATLFRVNSSRPTSPVFLPTLIRSQRDPAYEPYTFAEAPPLPLSGEEEIAETVCAAQAGAAENLIPTPGTPLVTAFTDVTVVGLSNAQIASDPPMSFPDEETVVAVVELSSLQGVPGVPAQLGMTGGFSMTQSCCPTSDFTTCSGASRECSLAGNFTATIAHSSITATVHVTEPDQTTGELVVAVESLAFEAGVDGLQITIELTSLPPERSARWNHMMQSALETDIARAAFVDVISHVLTQSSTMTSLGAVLSDAVNRLGPGGPR